MDLEKKTISNLNFDIEIQLVSHGRCIKVSRLFNVYQHENTHVRCIQKFSILNVPEEFHYPTDLLLTCILSSSSVSVSASDLAFASATTSKDEDQNKQRDQGKTLVQKQLPLENQHVLLSDPLNIEWKTKSIQSPIQFSFKNGILYQLIAKENRFISIEIWLQDESVFSIDDEFKFITFYSMDSDEIQMYSISDAPSLARNLSNNASRSYPLREILSEALKLYQSYTSFQTTLSLQKRNTKEDVKEIPIVKLPCQISIDSVGQFYCSCDYKLSIHFMDGILIQMKYGDSVLNLLDEFGEWIPLRLDSPVGFEKYVAFTRQFIMYLQGNGKENYTFLNRIQNVLDRSRNFVLK